MQIWCNGQFQDAVAPAVPAGDRGFQLGEGVFDTLLAKNGAPVWAGAHYARLSRHAGAFRIIPPYSRTIWEEAVIALLDRNRLTSGMARIRTNVTGGVGGKGLNRPETPAPLMTIAAAPFSGPPESLTAVIAQNVRRNEHSPSSRIKSLNYGDNLIAKGEARERGVNEAILLNTAGDVACATVANVFILEDGRLLTPPLDTGVMDGTMRAYLLDNGAEEDRISPERLFDAQAVMLANCLMGLMPVSKLDGRTLPGPPENILKPGRIVHG